MYNNYGSDVTDFSWFINNPDNIDLNITASQPLTVAAGATEDIGSTTGCCDDTIDFSIQFTWTDPNLMIIKSLTVPSDGDYCGVFENGDTYTVVLS